MGSDAYIYPETAAVLDLDVVIPPGVDIMPLNVSISFLSCTIYVLSSPFLFNLINFNLINLMNLFPEEGCPLFFSLILHNQDTA